MADDCTQRRVMAKSVESTSLFLFTSYPQGRQTNTKNMIRANQGKILAWGLELDLSHYSLKHGTDPCVVSVRGACLPPHRCANGAGHPDNNKKINFVLRGLHITVVRLTNPWPSNSRSNWNFRNVDFCRGRKTGEPGEKPSEQGREPTTNSTHL